MNDPTPWWANFAGCLLVLGFVVALTVMVVMVIAFGHV